MFKKYLFTVSTLLMALVTDINAGQWCANCYWGSDACPYITTQQVVATGAYNENSGLQPQDKGPFSQFYCDNGHTKLGVLWTDGKCSQNGGLTLTNTQDYKGVNKLKCTYGK